MKILTTFVAGGALALGLTAAASASTVANVQGNVCEGGVTPANTAPCPAAFNLGDFNKNVSDPTLQVVGETHIWGGVAHRIADRYVDNWTMDFGSEVYTGTFSWQPTSANFDGSLLVNGTEYTFSTADDASGGSFSIGQLTSSVTFILDPTAGQFSNNPDEVATWDLEVSQVPLPAGVVLLLTGLGGLAIAKRRNRA